MRALATSLRAWEAIERQEGVKAKHGLVFPLAVVEAIGRPHGLEMTAEEETDQHAGDFDAVFLTVLDSRLMLSAARHFRARLRLPFFRRDRSAGAPLVWAGGQGVHNPLPLAPAVDLFVMGDAEEPLPELLRLWDRHGGGSAFLKAAAMVEGVFVPSEHDPREVEIAQAVAPDASLTLREEISVNLNGIRRVEIARGCRYKCTFCSLGWRTPYRENSTEDVLQVIGSSPRLVHLQAGDAESHSGIDQIRDRLHESGGVDTGWTGRMDTLWERMTDNPDAVHPAYKKYAFGVEGVSFRLRVAVGKSFLTDERLVRDTVAYFSRVKDDLWGRAGWHLIAGLPGERPGEALDLMKVIQRIEANLPKKSRKGLTLHWQPFQPLPGTPMQWCAAGGGVRAMAAMLAPLEKDSWSPWLKVRQLKGRTDEVARLCAVLSRADERGADLIAAMADRRVSAKEAQSIAGATWGEIPLDSPLPWDFVRQWQPKEVLAKAHGAMMRKLG